MTDTLKFTILGCGSSGGVPRIGGEAAIQSDGRSAPAGEAAIQSDGRSAPAGEAAIQSDGRSAPAGGAAIQSDGRSAPAGHWGACDPNEPKNRRSRCSLLVARGETRVLVDTSPDLRMQLLNANAGTIDGVLFTHDHADQCHGIDDLRVVAGNARARIDTYMDEATAKTLLMRFGYCFKTPRGSSYPPILNACHLEPFVPVRIDGRGGIIEALPFDQKHGEIKSLGFRFGGLAYSSDVSGFPPASFKALEGLDCWIVDALRYKPHPSHAHVAQTLEWIERLKPKRAILTNLHTDLDYETLTRDLPAGVEPAYDGMVIELEVP